MSFTNYLLAIVGHREGVLSDSRVAVSCLLLSTRTRLAWQATDGFLVLGLTLLWRHVDLQRFLREACTYFRQDGNELSHDAT